MFERSGGHEVGTQGDSFFVVFPLAKDAVVAAVAAQQALAAHRWPEGVSVRVRMGLHTGEGAVAGGTYVGLDVHRAARISAAGHGGQILLSQATRDLIDHDLPEGIDLRDLGGQRLKDLRRPERLYQVIHPDLADQFPPLHSLDALPNNLPVQLTSFIGREEELEEIERLLASARLVTLRGPGGAGKTRLAIQAAADLLERHPDGTWLVELAPIAEPDLVAQTAATTVGLHEPARAAAETLADFLSERTALLVLDNCEQVRDAAGDLGGLLLRRCRNLRILATSREALGVGGEATFAVPPLALPDPEQLDSPEAAGRFPAVRLFVERAAQYKAGFSVTPGNAATIIEICRRLDGIPLAIELAAARTRVLSVEQIATRLENRFRLLTGGPRTALAHHQTLQATVDWSYDLLSDEERALFGRLAVFAGGFSLEAAEGVCPGGPIEAADVLDLLTALVDKSLALVDEDLSGESRYRLLDTLREYGLERLRASGELEAYRTRHRAFFLALAEGAEAQLQGPEQKAWLDRLEADHDNFRAALEWSRSDPGGAEPGLRLAGALWFFWEVRGYPNEGRRWLRELLARGEEAPVAVRVKALNAAASLALRQGAYDEVDTLANRSLALSVDLDDKRGAAMCMVILGTYACRLEHYNRAEELGGEGLSLSREAGDNWGTAWAQVILGLVARARGDHARAGPLLEESLARLRTLGHTWAVAIVLVNLGLLRRDQGDFEGAAVPLEEALGLFRQLGDKSYIAYTQLNLGSLASARHDYERAGGLYREALAIRRDLQEKRGVITCLAALGCVAAGLGRFDRAAALFGAFEAQRAAAGASIPPPFQSEYERQLAATEAALGGDAFRDACDRGRAMAMEDAVEFALA